MHNKVLLGTVNSDFAISSVRSIRRFAKLNEMFVSDLYYISILFVYSSFFAETHFSLSQKKNLHAAVSRKALSNAATVPLLLARIHEGRSQLENDIAGDAKAGVVDVADPERVHHLGIFGAVEAAPHYILLHNH